MTMKRILLFAIGAMISLQAGARTLYVDASRPNNNGNGLKTATAKKTIQAAVNAAKAGDTIVVLRGTYAPISTKNKKITIKAKSGASKTKIRYSGTKKADSAVVKLGKTWMKTTSYRDETGRTGTVTESSGSETKGTSTKLTGFTIDGAKSANDQWDNIFGVSGGTLKSCIVQNVSGKRTVCRAKLSACTLRNNSYLLVELSTLARCKILSNKGNTQYGKTASSKFTNCLLAQNDTVPMKGCTLANCTIAENTAFTMSSTKAWNTIFHGVASSQFAAKKKNTLTKCYKGKDPKFTNLEQEVWITNTTSNWVDDPNGPDTIPSKWTEDVYTTNYVGTVTNLIERLQEDIEGDPYDGREHSNFSTNKFDYLQITEVILHDGDIVTLEEKQCSDEVDEIETTPFYNASPRYYWLNCANNGNGDFCRWEDSDKGWVVRVTMKETKTQVERTGTIRGEWKKTTTRELSDEVVPGNYHLRKGSPCIDKGTKTAAAKKLFGSKDLDGKNRIRGKTVDIGCYEY